MRKKELLIKISELEKEVIELKDKLNKEIEEKELMAKDFEAKENVFKKHLDKKQEQKVNKTNKWLYGYPNEKYMYGGGKR